MYGIIRFLLLSQLCWKLCNIYVKIEYNGKSRERHVFSLFCVKVPFRNSYSCCSFICIWLRIPTIFSKIKNSYVYFIRSLFARHEHSEVYTWVSIVWFRIQIPNDGQWSFWNFFQLKSFQNNECYFNWFKHFFATSAPKKLCSRSCADIFLIVSKS